MSAHRVGILVICVAVAAALMSAACQQQAQSATPTAEELVERGRLLVMIGDCQICHSPKIFTEAGPEPDSSRMFMGHPADEPAPPIPAGVLSQTGWGA
ncbi:MAG TPA: hypothetical protein VLB27_11560, partial [candidate division Zixibacteria bacterium]|nr:hypothetical protein [candidate division Zixibacteria bacterium]